MKKKKTITFLSIVILLGIISFGIYKFRDSYAADVSSGFRVTDVKFCSDDACTIEYDETNGILGNNKFLSIIEWTYNSINPISNGDSISIPFGNEINTETTASWIGSVAKIPMYDNNDNIIGTWQLTGGAGANHRLIITFSDYAVGKTSLSGKLITSKNISSPYSFRDIVVPFTVGNTTKNIKILKNSFSEYINEGMTFSASTGNNERIPFYLTTPNRILNELYRYNEYENITDGAKLKNIICEVPIPNGTKNNTYSIIARATIPTDTENHYASSSQLFSVQTDIFEEITPNYGITYEGFKSLLKKYQYGTYTDSNNNKTYIINFGNIPNDDYTYEGILNMLPGDYAYEQNPFTNNSDIKDIINTALGSNNNINGKIAQIRMISYFYYNPVQVETPVTTMATCTYEKMDGTKITQQMTTTNKLIPATSIATVQGQAKLLLLDKDSKSPISGVSITLQKKENGTWTDVETMTTGEDGIITKNGLLDGEYRYIQNNYKEHYINGSYKLYSDSATTREIETFTLNSDGNVSYATNERETYTITYNPGAYGNFETKTYTVRYGDATPIYTETNGIDEWIFTNWDKSVELIVTGNAEYTAQWEKKVTMTVHYLDEEGNKLEEDEIKQLVVGSNYEVEEKQIEGYEIVVPENIKGTVPNEDFEVTIVYKKKGEVTPTEPKKDVPPKEDNKTKEKSAEWKVTVKEAKPYTPNTVDKILIYIEVASISLLLIIFISIGIKKLKLK